MTFWYADAHSCLPLHGDTDINQLRLHYDAGVRYLSVNVGMDMNPLAQIMTTIAGFRQQIADSDWIELAETHADILRIANNNKLAISFDLEGALPLLESPNMVALYHRLGVRQIHLAYNRSNSVAGGAHDSGSLTSLGEQIVDAIHAAGILMDLSHSNEQTALDICTYSGNRPVLYSHANPQALVPHGRNITDRAIRACASTGGIIALNGVGTFIGDPDLQPRSLIPFIDYIVQMVGIEHVAIGLDYCYDDGVPDIPANVNRQYWWPPSSGYDPKKGLSGKYVSPSGLEEIHKGLQQRGYHEADVKAIMRDNLLRLIANVWIPKDDNF
ncbi:MAG: membrane dipeptidase [Cardiobacteriaceae bacterium]|nr:membrane dipeptidase [Cardiobacteriaceae bacterium]